MKRRLPPPLVALSPGDLTAASVERFLGAVAAAVAAGLRGILVREPEMGDRDLLGVATAVRERLGEKAWLGIHDRVHLAEACRADAVHLGFRSLLPAEARRILANEIAIGFSAHAADDPALWHGADYLFFGPVLETPSKRGLVEPMGFDALAAAVARSPLPVWAIGGLRPEDVRGCLDAACSGIAVRSGILATRDVALASVAYLERWA